MTRRGLVREHLPSGDQRVRHGRRGPLLRRDPGAEADLRRHARPGRDRQRFSASRRRSCARWSSNARTATEFELVEFRQPRGRTSTDREMNDAGIAALALRVTGLDRLVGCGRSGRLQAALRHRRADIARWGDSAGRGVRRAGQGQDHPGRASGREEEPGERRERQQCFVVAGAFVAACTSRSKQGALSEGGSSQWARGMSMPGERR